MSRDHHADVVRFSRLAADSRRAGLKRITIFPFERKHTHRFRAIMDRISRERWITPKEFVEISDKITAHIGCYYSARYWQWCGMEYGNRVGWFRGRPMAFPGTEAWPKAEKAAALEEKKPGAGYALILSHMANGKGLNNGYYW